MKVVIVGAGLYGATMARSLHDGGHEVLVLERRRAVGGQVMTRFDKAVGCHMHLHGPHIFRTQSDAIWEYVNRFAQFNSFVNRPKVVYRSALYSFPINLMTLYQVFGVVSPREAATVLARDRLPIANPANMEEWCHANIGPRLYAIFIEGYTTKQWGRHPRDLPASLLQRLPIRLTFDDNYYKGNPKQGIPIGGYSAMVEKMLDGVAVELGCDALPDIELLKRGHDIVVYSGAIDEFFGYELGVLEYRTMRFEHEVLASEDYQGNAVLNYTDIDIPWTRVIEHKHFDLIEGNSKTVVTWEFPEVYQRGKDATYPLRTAESRALYDHYVEYAKKHARNVVFGGRLGSYSYLDMDQVISSALARARSLSAR